MGKNAKKNGCFFTVNFTKKKLVQILLIMYWFQSSKIEVGVFH